MGSYFPGLLSIPILLLLLPFISQTNAEKWLINGTVLCLGSTMNTLEEMVEGGGPVDFVDYAGAKVYFMEADTMDPDDQMDLKESDQSGAFQVKGEENETFGTPRPYLLVEHNCTNALYPPKKRCVYRTRMEVPLRPERQQITLLLGSKHLAEKMDLKTELKC